MLAVSDNAANIKNAILTILGWKHFPCLAHTINLIVKDGLSVVAISLLIDRVKGIVTYFRRSTKAWQELKSYQIKNGTTGEKPKKLLQDVATRWNSTYYMLQRFSELQNAIRSTMGILNHNLTILTADEWQIVAQLCEVLKPFECVTRSISGQKYATASLVIVLVKGLTDVCTKLSAKVDYGVEVKSVVTKLSQGLKERLSNVEFSNTLATATFLDPRFKSFAFSSEAAGKTAKQNVINAVFAKIGREAHANVEEEQGSFLSHSDSDEFSIWSSFDKTVAVAQPEGTSSSRAIIEVQRYVEEKLLPRDKDPLQWWRVNHYNYPHLSKVVLERFCALATSVPCERLFSKAGLILNERRTSLSAEKARQLLFLNNNEESSE